MRIFWKILLAAVVLLVISAGGYGYRTLKAADEITRTSWSEVLSQYQSRENLAGPLINMAQINLSQEQRYLWLAVNDAVLRVKPVEAVGTELLDDPDAFARYLAAQAELTEALSRLTAAAESNPQLQANMDLISLTLQLSSAEGRIFAARRSYAKAVQEYNAALTSNYPAAKLFGYVMRPVIAAESWKTN